MQMLKEQKAEAWDLLRKTLKEMVAETGSEFIKNTCCLMLGYMLDTEEEVQKTGWKENERKG